MAEWIGIISGILGIISFFLPERNGKLTASLLFICFCAFFYFGMRYEKGNKDSIQENIEGCSLINLAYGQCIDEFNTKIKAKKLRKFEVEDSRIYGNMEYNIEIPVKKKIAENELLAVFKLIAPPTNAFNGAYEMIIFSIQNGELTIKIRQDKIGTMGSYGNIEKISIIDIGIPAVLFEDEKGNQGSFSSKYRIVAYYKKRILTIFEGRNWYSCNYNPNEYTGYNSEISFVKSKGNIKNMIITYHNTSDINMDLSKAIGSEELEFVFGSPDNPKVVKKYSFSEKLGQAQYW